MPGDGFVARGLETEPDVSGSAAHTETLSTVFVTPDYFQMPGCSSSPDVCAIRAR
jgi:hypothetical protein